MGRLLSVAADTKTVKGGKAGYLTGILYLIPDDGLCPNSANAGCREGCLVTAGLASVYKTVNAARLAKTEWFKADRAGFMLQLCKDIETLIRKADRENMTQCVRLNGTSDIAWENVSFTDSGGMHHRNIMAKYPDLQFYDYTKLPRRTLEKNYHLTYSYSAAPSYAKTLEKMIRHGNPIAVVFSGKEFPATFLRRRVINGDETDLRFLDDDGVVVGLKAKGAMRKDTGSGMVVTIN
jgi:hypothetical protein